MRKLNTSYLNWVSNYCAKSLGIWGLLGLALGIFSLLIYLTKMMDVDKELNLALAQYNQLQANKPVPAQTIAAPAVTTEQEVIDFYHSFPTGASLSKLLGQIDDSAVKQRLVLNRGDYKLIQTKEGKLTRYEIVLPVIGKYSQIRQFLVDILYKIPTIAVTDMQIKRESSTSPMVEARVVFVLFMQSDQW